MQELKKLILRRYPTEYHKKAWGSFEKICMLRSTLGLIKKLVGSLFLMLLGKADFQRAELYIASASEDELEVMVVSKQIMPYLKWIYITLTLGRFVLLLLSIKNLRISKTYFYYEHVLFLCSAAMPLGLPADAQNDVDFAALQVNFAMFFFDVWPCLVCSLVSQVLTPVFRAINYGEEFDMQVVKSALGMMVSVTLAYLMIHCIFTQLGFALVGAEVERGSNRLLVNNLEEGVVLLEQDTKTVLFLNHAAEKLNVSSDVGKRESGDFLFSMSADLFAPIDG